MAESANTPHAPTTGDDGSGPLSFTLHVVSPSVGVSSPLNFPHLLATTTVKELKAKIRDVLPSKPADESQRLIHRGRMLGRETESMLEVFGQEVLAQPDDQTLHLVLRPTAADPPSWAPPATPIPIPQIPIPQARIGTPPLPPQFQPRPLSTPINPLQTMQNQAMQAQAVQAQAMQAQAMQAQAMQAQVMQAGMQGIHGMHAQQPLPGFQHAQQHQVLHQVEHVQNAMAQRLAQLQRETQRLHQEMALIEQRARAHTGQVNGLGQQPMQNPGIAPTSIFRSAPAPPPLLPQLQQLINQGQRERAAEGRQGLQDTGAMPAQPSQIPQTASGRASPSAHRPDGTTTYTREGVGPNGERWSVSVNETTMTFPMQQQLQQLQQQQQQGLHQPHHHHHHHPIPHANPALDIQAVLRNADRHLAQERLANGSQRSASVPAQARATLATPGITRPDTPGSVGTPATSSSPTAATIHNPLLTGNASSTSMPSQANTIAPDGSNSNEPIVYLLSSPSGPRALLLTNSETYFTPRRSSRRRHSPPTQVPGQPPAAAVLPEYRNRAAQRAALGNDGAPAAPIAGHAAHANPGAGALAVQIGPLIWLMVRLIGFVWFFTAGNPSWTRWLMVSGLGLIVFLYNTGWLNGFANEFLGPVRRHLEVLIPLAGPEAALVPAVNAAVPQPAQPVPPGTTPQQPRRGDLDPREAAERILEERRQARARPGWLMAQMRRAEHSMLLFLASLVPGVGERHIAAREAEANAAEAERQRLIHATEAAEAAANAENTEGTVGVEGMEGTGETRDDINGAPTNDGAAAPAQPLIEV